MKPLPRNKHWPPFYIYAQSAVIALVAWFLLRDFYVDDSYISLRYARNLLDGLGLVWQPGERVEGYSNFLFVILTAALGAIGIELTLATRIISLLSYFALVAIVALYCGIRQKQASYAHEVNRALAISVVASSLPILAWCMGGLETALYAALLTGGVCLVLRELQGAQSIKEAVVAGLCFGLAALTRPDGAIFGAFAIGWPGLLWLGQRDRKTFVRLFIMSLCFALPVIAYTLWRVSYFGDWMANTYYAKTYGYDSTLLWTTGIAYLLQYMLMPPLLLLAVTMLAIIVCRLQKFDAPRLFLACFIALYVLYVVKVGGDFMRYFRFFAPLVPIIALFIFHAGKWLATHREKWLRDLTGILLFFSVFQFGMIDQAQRQHSDTAIATYVAAYIGAHWKEGATVAINPAGALPYMRPQFRYIDMLGLVDKKIARASVSASDIVNIAAGHFKADGKYVLSRQPDYIILGHVWGTDAPVFASDKQLLQNPVFLAWYQRKEALIDVSSGNFIARPVKQGKPAWLPPVDEQGKLHFVYYQKKR